MEFGKALRRLRAERGFRTAYQFYHANGGRRTFPFTYAYYKKIENGTSLPRASWLLIIVQGFRIPHGHPDVRKLARMFFIDLCGDAAAFDFLVTAALNSGSDNAEGSDAKLVRGFTARASFNLDAKRSTMIMSSKIVCDCYVYLIARGRACNLREISAAVDADERSCRAALERLCQERLARRLRDGTYAPLDSDKAHILSYLPTMSPNMQAFFRQRADAAAVHLLNTTIVARLNSSGANDIAGKISRAAEMALAYEVPVEASPEAHIYSFETRVTKIFH